MNRGHHTCTPVFYQETVRFTGHQKQNTEGVKPPDLCENKMVFAENPKEWTVFCAN